tara:strand:- start:109 stop:771 length:663 start_codon:yes stop_codon:yes gene_type:complete
MIPEKFWIEDISVLYENFCMFNPLIIFNNKPISNILNAYTRLVIITIIVIFTINKNINYIYIGLILILILIIIYYIFKSKKDSFSVSSPEKSNNLPQRKSDFYNTKKLVNNPLKNVKISEYNVQPIYSKATQSDLSMNKYINNQLFQTADQWIFDKQARPYYTTAISAVPNDQTAFANWLYGTKNICKENSIYMNRLDKKEEALMCNGFNAQTPTNLGLL